MLSLLFLSAFIAGVALIAAIIAGTVRFLSRSDALAVVVGTLLVPAIFCGSLWHWILTMEADDAPPGPVIEGTLIIIAIATPIALIASKWSVRALSRRAARNPR